MGGRGAVRRLGERIAAAIAAASLGAGSAAAAPVAWVQLVAGHAEVRAAPADGRCPEVKLDGRLRAMVLRTPAEGDFPAVCALELPRGIGRASLAAEALPLPASKVRRIVLFGDSGCRVKGADVQACNDPRAWPFAAVAARAAARRPDLVIHVGDYYYRETPCPAGRAGCAGTPHGDNWTAWEADFFGPAAPLLKVAPWVFVRGNHESCSRGGPGWFRLLDASPQPKSCPASSDPFAVDLGGLKLYVLDSADAPDRSAPSASVAAFASQLDALQPALARERGWIVTHRPIWGLVPVARIGPIGPLSLAINLTEQAAVSGRDLGAVDLVVSGHIHDFASLDLSPVRPSQLIVGTGGDIGQAADTRRVRVGQATIDGLQGERTTFDRFGYLVLDRIGRGADDWNGVFYDDRDRPVVRCRLRGRSLRCTPAK